MLTLSPTLLAHQRGTRRVPAVRVEFTAARGGLPLFVWERLYSGGEGDGPQAAALAGDGALLRVRTSGGTLYTSRTVAPGAESDFSSWSALTSGVSATGGVALSVAAGGEAVLAYTTGTALLVRTSANHGASWSAATTVVTEGSAIGAIAAAHAPNGDVMLFYVLGTSTTVKRLRRSSGTWAGSGTTWSRSASVASVTGIAAVHDGNDFQLLLTGTEATTTHRRVWGCFMGDLLFPAGAWSGLVTAAEADAASGTTFAGPAVALDGSLALRGLFAQVEAGDVPATRVMETAAPFGDATSSWGVGSPHEGAQTRPALAVGADAWLTTANGVWRALLPGAEDVSDRVVRLKARSSGARAHLELELEDSGGELWASDVVRAGCSVRIDAGYRSGAGGEAEYGRSWHYTVDRVSLAKRPGRRVVVVEGSGALDQLERWRAPQAWQVAAGTLSRSQLAARLCARAGFAGTGSGASAEFLNVQPAFAMAQGESAAAALLRLLRPAAEVVLPVRTEGLEFTALASTASTYTYGAGEHEIAELELLAGRPGANWVRLQGLDRYADAHEWASIYQHGPELRLVRNVDATTNNRASTDAAATVAKESGLWSAGRAVVPANVGQDLYDVVTVEGTAYRVLALGLDYRRGPSGARYDTLLELGVV